MRGSVEAWEERIFVDIATVFARHEPFTGMRSTTGGKHAFMSDVVDRGLIGVQKGEQHGSGCGVEDRENRVVAVVGKVESHARVSGEPRFGRAREKAYGVEIGGEEFCDEVLGKVARASNGDYDFGVRHCCL